MTSTFQERVNLYKMAHNRPPPYPADKDEWERTTKETPKKIDAVLPDKKKSMPLTPDTIISCDWPTLRTQLLLQWPRLTMEELDRTKQNRHQVALLVEQKYNIAPEMVDNYLCNYERTMPLN